MLAYDQRGVMLDKHRRRTAKASRRDTSLYMGAVLEVPNVLIVLFLNLSSSPRLSLSSRILSDAKDGARIAEKSNTPCPNIAGFVNWVVGFFAATLCA